MRAFMAICMFLLLVFGTWQIFTRWILRDPSTFTDEVLRYLLIWASMIGSAYCFYSDEHLALDLLKDRVHGVGKVILNVIIEVCVLFFVGYVFIFGGWKIAMRATNVSSVLRIPFKMLYLIMPISGVLVYVARILKYAKMIALGKGGKK